MTRGRVGAAVRLGAHVLALAAGLAVLWEAGRALPPVPVDGASLQRTFDEADPLAVAVGLVRLLALGVGAALLATTLLGVVARGCGAARLVVRLDRWTPPGVRRLLDGALGVGLAATVGLGALPAGADAGAGPPPTAATLRRLPDTAPSTLRRLPDSGLAPPTDRSPPTSRPERPVPTLRRLDDAASAPPAPVPVPAPAPVPAPPVTAAAPAVPSPRVPVPAAAAPALAPAPEVPAAAAAREPREVVVQPGDSFWRLAERHEAERLGRQPTEAEVGAFWQRLVATNRHRLAVPGDADLLFPGQVLLLPGSVPVGT